MYYYYMTRQTAKEYLESIKDFNSVMKEAKSPRLPVTVLVSAGERFDQAFLFKSLQYDPIVVPTIPNTERSSKLILEDSDTGNNYVPEILHYGEANGTKDKVRSLRMSWAFATEVSPVISSDIHGIIVCERRALPLLRAADLYAIVKNIINTYPDTDVIRLFNNHSGDKYTIDTLDEVPRPDVDVSADKISKPLPAGKDRTRLSPECDGTYALYIADASRSKVAGLFRRTRMPVDTALEYAQAHGQLNVRTLTIDAFVRDGGIKHPVPGYRYCVQLSSYNRPMQLLSQIIAIKEQLRYVADPSRVLVHVVIRGCDRVTYNILKERIELELSSYNCKVIARPNRNQLLNFTEAPAMYDFYLKMDDDDFYDPLYLETTISFHDKLPLCVCSSMSGGPRGVAVSMRSEAQDRSVVRTDKTGACENTLVLSREMIPHLLRIAAASSNVCVTSSKAADAVPMRSMMHSKLGFNRYEYWRMWSILKGRNVESFSILNYEGSAHATGMSNFGAFASTAGAAAAEYYVRMFDCITYLKGTSDGDFVRENFHKYSGMDVAIVTDHPGDPMGMYIPMNTKWCSPELGASQLVKDITYTEDGAFVEGFTFCRTGHRFIFDPGRGVMMPESVYEKWKSDPEKGTKDCQDWLMNSIHKPGDPPR